MANQTTGDPAAMARAAADFDAARATLKGLQMQVQSTVDASIGVYDTDAATTFRNVMLRWVDDFSAIIGGLDVTHEKLLATRSAMQNTQGTDAAGASRIASLLGQTSH